MKNPLFPGDQTQVVADAIITRALEAISTLPPSPGISPSTIILTSLRAALELALTAESSLHPDRTPEELRLVMASTFIKYGPVPLDNWAPDARETVDRILSACRP